MALHLDDYGRWPLWRAPAEVAAAITDGYGQIACFVSPEALEGLRGLSAGVGTAVRTGAGGMGGAAACRTIAERLYEQLSRCAIRYDTAPWEPGAGQRLRHPGWALAPQESATCVDFAIMFAAMCLRERLAPFLVLLRGERYRVPVGHVMVGVDLDRGPEALTDAAPLAACAEEPSAGVSRVVERTLLVEDPAVLLVDPTFASRDHQLSFDRSVAAAGETLRRAGYGHVHLVDVARRHDLGDTPLPAPRGRAALRRRLPSPRHPVERFASRAHAQERLAGLSPLMVVVGESGVGKSELARDTAARVDHGVGWFLTATNQDALIASLAEAELAERGGELGLPDDRVLRIELARAALSRLGRADTPWAVVVDNADCLPSELRRWLPRPDRAAGQVLIVTTTESAWREESGEVIAIEALQPDEVEAQLGDVRLVKLASGRPLLIQAFLAAAAHLQVSLEELAERLSARAGGPQDLAGPRALWDLLTVALSEPAADAAKALAWLLPDRTPVRILNQAHADAPAAVDELVSAGLVSWSTDGREQLASMHRLFGRAIRRDLRERAEDRKIVTALLGLRAVQELLLVGADPQITAELAESLIDDKPPGAGTPRDHLRGAALWALGTIQEMYQGVKTSAVTLKHAMSYLDENQADDRPLIADCLHGQARQVNHQRRPPPDAVTRARQWMAKAIGLRDHADIAGLSKHRALDGLLLQRHARDQLPPGSDEQIAGLREACDILEKSWLERRAVPEVDQRLVDRAYFNRAGVRLDLAQRVPSEAADLLRVAEQVYRETLEFRRGTYPNPSPLTAASHNGLATCLYYRALFDAEADRDLLLVEATDQATLALSQRRVTDGDRDGDDVVKSASILAKLALARVRAVDAEAFAEVLADVGRELSMP